MPWPEFGSSRLRRYLHSCFSPLIANIHASCVMSEHICGKCPGVATLLAPLLPLFFFFIPPSLLCNPHPAAPLSSGLGHGVLALLFPERFPASCLVLTKRPPCCRAWSLGCRTFCSSCSSSTNKQLAAHETSNLQHILPLVLSSPSGPPAVGPGAWVVGQGCRFFNQTAPLAPLMPGTLCTLFQQQATCSA